MTIVVDAYNILKQVLHTDFINESQRLKFMQEFDVYVQKRKNEVILVFDGGISLDEDVSSVKHIQVVYSGQMHSADDWIKQFVKQGQGKDILLVTSDRELRRYAALYHIESIGSLRFYEIMKQIMQQEVIHDKNMKNALCKTTNLDNLEVDMLMEEGSRILMKQSIEKKDSGRGIRLSSGQKASKKNKRLFRKITKI